MSVNKERKPRILLVSHTAGKYGAERSLLTLADRLQAQGLADVVVLLPETGPLLDDLRSKGIETKVIQYKFWIGYSWARMAFLKRLTRVPLTVIGALRAWPWARKWDPDLVYINTVASPMGLILASLLGKPHIWHVREWIGGELNSKYDLGRSIVMSLLNRGKAEIIFNSRAIADIYAEHLPAAKAVIVYNGFDFSDLSPPDAHRRYKNTVANAPVVRLAVIGSVQPAKGQEYAIRALPALLTEGLPVRLEIMGSGTSEYIGQLESLAAELRVADYVSFKGYIADIAGHLDGVAAVLVPSRYESFGRVAVEAQSHGVPVVAAATGGLLEIVLDGKTGLLFPLGNFSQLAAKVAILLQDRALYESFVAEAWLRVTQQFTQDRYVAGVWAVMLNAINEVDTGEGIIQG